MEPWWIHLPVIADSYHFEVQGSHSHSHGSEKLYPDPHSNKNLDPDPQYNDADLQPCLQACLPPPYRTPAVAVVVKSFLSLFKVLFSLFRLFTSVII